MEKRVQLPSRLPNFENVAHHATFLTQNLQVAKWEGVGLQNRLLVGSIPTLESNRRSVA